MSVYEEKESYAVSRAGGIGGTDAAAILNLSPWKRPIDIYAGKINPGAQAELDKECLLWGNLLEPVVRQQYANKFNVVVTNPLDLGTLFPNSRRWNDSTLVVGDEDWMLGAPDGWIQADREGLEIKTAARKTGEWGGEDTDEIPAHYLIQVAWYMAVLQAPAWNFGTLFSGNKLERYRVLRDGQLETAMVEACSSFWHDNVLKQVEPDIDESESYGRYLARKFSLSTGNVIKNPSIELVEWGFKMKAADDDEKDAKERKQLANNHLRALVGDSQKAIVKGVGTLGWVRPEEKLVTDEKAALAALVPLYDEARAANAVTASEIIAKHTSPRKNDAYFRGWYSK